MGAAKQSVIFSWLVLCLSLALATQTYAQSFSAEEISELNRTIKQFVTDTIVSDAKGVVKVMPPMIWKYFKDKGKFSDDELELLIDNRMKENSARAKITGFEMNESEATLHQLTDGSAYLLIPTETRIELSTGKIYIVRNQTLALLEGGKWYLARIDDPQQRQVLAEVYPAFQGVWFPEAQSETVRE